MAQTEASKAAGDGDHENQPPRDVVHGVHMPESTKLIDVSEDSQKIGEFLEALGSQGIQLMKWVEKDYEEPCSGELFSAGCDGGKKRLDFGPDGAGGPYTSQRACGVCGGTGVVKKHVEGFEPAFSSIDRALADYFEIDMDKVERERAELLKRLQEG